MKLIRGYYFPDNDEHCHKVTIDEVKTVEKALVHVQHKGVCIQAGGNVGVWADYLSRQFDVVYSFEPDPDNFQCFNENVKARNVFRYQSVLGDTRMLIDLDYEYDPNNCGAYIANKHGVIPTLRIDDLGLERLDFLELDVEGMEWLAIQGGWNTINKYRPVIQYEDKSLSEIFGSKKGQIEEEMKMLGYEVVDRVKRDVIIACTSR